MTHDDLVIWAYENAHELIKQAGFAPKIPDVASESGRARLLCRYADLVKKERENRLLKDLAGRASLRPTNGPWSSETIDTYLQRLAGRDGVDAAVLYQAVAQEIAKRRDEWPSDCRSPNDVCWPELPADWFSVANRILEMPVKRDGGRRFIDLVVKIDYLVLTLSVHGETQIRASGEGHFFFEIKPTIRRLDEILQQCRIYREGVDCSGLAVVSPDTRYKSIIEAQGFPFIVPGIGQQSLDL